MAKIKGVIIQTPKAAGKFEEPHVTVTLPAEVEVGDKITPSVEVMREDTVTPVVGTDVHFFVEDSISIESLGTGVTDVNGIATAPGPFMVSEEQSEQTITFIVFVRGKKI